MTTVRLDLEYDGSGFRGWSKQPFLRTVQGELESALTTVLRKPVELTVAGRTDTGVHAWGQVASFDTTADIPDDLAYRLNGVGPADIAVTAASAAPDGFNARHDAKSRSYCYRVLARRAPSPFEQRRALWWPHALDLEALRSCATSLLGNHDFTAFTPTQTDHVRFDRNVFTASWDMQGDLATFRITADAFMRNMVRVLVGTQLEVAAARRTVESFSDLLHGAPRSEAGDTAHPTVSTWSPSRTNEAPIERRVCARKRGAPPELADTQNAGLIRPAVVRAGGAPRFPTLRPARDRPSQSSPTSSGPT